MFQSSYNKVLTIILVVVVIATVGLLGFLGYDYWNKYVSTQNQSKVVDEFISEAIRKTETTDNTENEGNEDDGSENEGEEGNSGSMSASSLSNSSNDNQTTTSQQSVKTYNGHPMLGTLEATKTSYKLPVLGDTTSDALNDGVSVLCGPGLNEVGNTVIIGHNYRNGTLFAKNDQLVAGDLIYITDDTGRRKAYSVYNKFLAEPNDSSFYSRDTNGKAEITLSTCTNDGKKRIIIFAAEVS